MGRSTVMQLITRGKNQNEYNNTGLDTNPKWVDYFNEAINDLAADLMILEPLTINVAVGTREYDLPEDFLQLYSFVDGSGTPIKQRRTYEDRTIKGYYVLNKGNKFVVDMYTWNSADTCTGLYQRYPAVVSLAEQDQKPEVPTLGENALIYYAIAKALRNNNLPGQAQEVEAKYELERRKIRSAANLAMLGANI